MPGSGHCSPFISESVIMVDNPLLVGYPVMHTKAIGEKSFAFTGRFEGLAGVNIVFEMLQTEFQKKPGCVIQLLMV